MKKLLFFVILLSISFVGLTVTSNAQATWTTTSVDTTNMGYGVTYDEVHGTSTSNFSTATQSINRQQSIYTVNVQKGSSASVVIWGMNKMENTWGSYTLEQIAADYEAKHPDKKVLAATNNWLSDCQSDNIGELDAVQVIDGLNYRVSDKQGTTGGESVTFSHGYIHRPNFLGFDATGKKAYFSDNWSSSNYSSQLMLSYYNGVDTERTKLNLSINKINEAPAEGEISIIFPNYNGSTVFPGATIYKMKAVKMRYDTTMGLTTFVARDAFAYGKLVEKVTDFTLDPPQAKKGFYYIVSKNSSFDALDLTDKTLVSQYELLGEFSNVVGATTYYYHIVKNGETYPEGHPHEINDEVHPRTAFVIKKDGSFAISVIDGRQLAGNGMEYMEMSYFYKTFYDGYNVFNYDGGGSSAMIIANNNGGFEVVNSPSDGRERAVANATMVVVDKDPYQVTQSEVSEHGFTLKLENKTENVANVYATVNGKTLEFINDEVEFTDLAENGNYEVFTSYKLKDGIEKTGFAIQARTCGLFTKIRKVTFDDITQSTAVVKVSLIDEGSTFFQGMVEVGTSKEYFNTEIASVDIKNLKSSTTYDVFVHIFSKDGTRDNHEDIYTYSLTTPAAKYPEAISLSVPNPQMNVGDKQQMVVTYNPEGTRTYLTYTSSNETVLTIDSGGYIKALSEGTSTITVTTKEGVTSTLEITVTNEAPAPKKKGCKKSSALMITALGLGSLLMAIVIKRKH